MQTLSVAGVTIPVLGFGTWQVEGADARRMVETALRIGYRHIDTAKIYGNEREVGDGLKASGVARGDIFLTTKIWTNATANGDLQRAAESQLKALGVDHVDLLLLHWPTPAVPLAESIGALNDVLKRGMARAVGVSNYPSKLLEQAAHLSEAPLATDQVEYHPYLNQQKVLETAREHGLSVTAYSPLARGRVLNDPVLAEIAEAHGRTVSQVVIRWLMQQSDVIVIPKTLSEARARENFAAHDFELSAPDMGRIFDLARPDGRVINPPDPPQWD